MAVYAAMVDNVDQNVGRLLDAVERLGEADNTIVILTSDNGASREGEECGTSSYFTHLIGTPNWEDDYERLDQIGGPRTMSHVPRGWAMASNTPFRLYKINTHAGGHRVPFIMSWPERLDAGSEMRRQYTHVTDVLPTLLELCGLEMPTERHGQPLKPPAGVSFAPTLDDAVAPSRHREQHAESWGHRGYYRDGWEIVAAHQPWQPFGDHEWELFDLENDPTECHDLAAEHPEKVAELAAAWEAAAWANQVYPLEDGTMLKHIIRPPEVADLDAPVTILAGTPTLERWRSQRLIWVRSFVATVSLDHRRSDRGMLVAHGDQGGGYALYVGDSGQLVFAHNDGHRTRRMEGGPLRDGASQVVRRCPGARREHLDGRAVRRRRRGLPRGRIRRLPVDGPLRGHRCGDRPAFPGRLGRLPESRGRIPYTGVIHSVRYEPGNTPPTHRSGWSTRCGRWPASSPDVSTDSRRPLAADPEIGTGGRRDRAGCSGGLGLGDLASDVVHVEVVHGLDQLIEGRRRQRARLIEDEDPVAEGHEGRDRHDAEAAGERLLGLGVHLGEGHLGVGLRRLVEDRPEHATGTAPRGPEVDEDDPVGGHGVLERVGGQVGGAHSILQSWGIPIITAIPPGVFPVTRCTPVGRCVRENHRSGRFISRSSEPADREANDESLRVPPSMRSAGVTPAESAQVAVRSGSGAESRTLHNEYFRRRRPERGSSGGVLAGHGIHLFHQPPQDGGRRHAVG